MGYGVAYHHDLRIGSYAPLSIQNSGMPLGPVVETVIPALSQRLYDIRKIGCSAEGVVNRLQSGHGVCLSAIHSEEIVLFSAFFPGDNLHREIGLSLKDVPDRFCRPVNSLDRNIVNGDSLLDRHRLEMEIRSAGGSDLHPFHLIVKWQIESEPIAILGRLTVIHTERERQRVSDRLPQIRCPVKQMESSIVVDVVKVNSNRGHFCRPLRNIPAVKHITHRNFRRICSEINVASVKCPASSERPFRLFCQRVMPLFQNCCLRHSRKRQHQNGRRHRSSYNS